MRILVKRKLICQFHVIFFSSSSALLTRPGRMKEKRLNALTEMHSLLTATSFFLWFAEKWPCWRWWCFGWSKRLSKQAATASAVEVAIGHKAKASLTHAHTRVCIKKLYYLKFFSWNWSMYTYFISLTKW